MNSNPFVNKTSIIPTYNPIIKETPITINVNLIVSARVGQLTFLSSSTTSLAILGLLTLFAILVFYHDYKDSAM